MFALLIAGCFAVEDWKVEFLGDYSHCWSLKASAGLGYMYKAIFIPTRGYYQLSGR